jgi:hypothetical protein
LTNDLGKGASKSGVMTRLRPAPKRRRSAVNSKGRGVVESEKGKAFLEMTYERNRLVNKEGREDVEAEIEQR